MGVFGCPHCDSKDCPGYVTHMFVNSDMPDYYDPGQMHILGLGIFVHLAKYTGICFCGLRYHGASPPMAPPGTEVVPWAYRGAGIEYPPKGMTNDKTKYALGSVPRPTHGNGPMFVSPEMMGDG